MATITQPHISSSLMNHPAHLYVGAHGSMRETVVEQLQLVFCSKQGCYTCTSCRQIAQGTHHSLLWLTTPATYTREDIEKVHEAMRFSLESHNHFFIIIEHAERLNQSSANSLLACMEEPPSGYHFILLVERPDQLLPTIRSRCIVQAQQRLVSSDRSHPLFLLFSQTTTLDSLLFVTELENNPPNEQETLSILDALLVHWQSIVTQCYKNNTNDQLKLAQAKLNVLIHALKSLPMPGSSKIFWKNLALWFISR